MCVAEECRSNHQSPLARGSHITIHIVSPHPSAGTLATSHHIFWCMAYTIMDHARHHLLTTIAQDRALACTGYRCVVRFVSGRGA